MATSGPLTLLIITAFAAAVVGRLRSLPMTYLGALILALAVVYSQTFLQFGGRWGQLPLALPTVMLFIVLLLLPSAQLQFARINVARHSARVSTVRDTVIGMSVLFAAMVLVSAILSPVNMNRFALGMCTALVALSLVPLIGWAGQVSLAPLAFAGMGAVAYTRLGGADGHWYAVLLAALVVMPVGTVLALAAMRLQGLYLALATMAFASTVEYVFFTQPFALGTRDRKVERLHLLWFDFASTRSFLLLCTAVFALTGIAVIALRRSALGRRFVALRDSEAASATVGVNILETKVAVFTLSAGMAGFAGAFLAMYYETVNGQQFTMLAGLSIVLALVIGGVASVAGALFAGMFRLGTLLIQDNWHLSLWKAFDYLAPGLASFGIIENPEGAVVPMGEGFAPLLPWRHDAKREAAALKEANAEPEVGDLGLTRAFTEADVLITDRALGITNAVPRRVEHAPLESEVDAARVESSEPQPAAGD
jgi:branched-chain amino acid transport system permease protein